MTIQELRDRQSWPLYQKIDHSVGVIESFIARTGKEVHISFSGGKDSTVLLDLARRFVDKNIEAVFCNTGNEFPEIVKFVRRFDNVTIIRPDLSVREVLARYGFPLVSKENAQKIRKARHTKSEKSRFQLLNKQPGQKLGFIPKCWKYLVDAPFETSEKCCEILKKRPLHKFERATGKLPIIGTMACESRLRLQAYLRRGGCNSFTGRNKMCAPLSIWTENDIWAYKKEFGIEFCSLYDAGFDRTGCMFCGFGAQCKGDARFDRLRELHPRAYEVFMRYTNSGVTYREALRYAKVRLPDEI